MLVERDAPEVDRSDHVVAERNLAEVHRLVDVVAARCLAEIHASDHVVAEGVDREVISQKVLVGWVSIAVRYLSQCRYLKAMMSRMMVSM